MMHESKEPENQSKYLELSVVNVHQLGVGLSASYLFDEWGGSIGASPNDNWVLRDNQSDIQLNHAEINFIDGAFCLTDNANATFINSATKPIGSNASVKLNDKDIIQMGEYQLRVSFVFAEDGKASHLGGLEQAFPSQFDVLDLGDIYQTTDVPLYEANKHCDPLEALDAMHDLNEKKSIFDKDDLLKNDLLADEKKDTHLMMQADSEYEMSAAMSLKKQSMSENNIYSVNIHSSSYSLSLSQSNDNGHDKTPQRDNKGTAMTTTFDNNLLDQIEQEMEQEFNSTWQKKSNPFADDQSLMEFDTDLLEESNHVVVGPLLKGLGAKIGNASNMGRMQALSEELGASLQAAIQGLLALHQQVEESRFGVMNKNLQPIEDNPLRLGLDYQETVQTLFDGQRSIVHLSAPSAIEETLRNVRNHNEAVQEATTHALTQILHAFSPEVLMKRFAAYQRTGQVSSLSPEAWAWHMYQSYYEELTSNRQKGFEKLFWEIFEQAYDKKIRDLQRES